MASAEQEDKKPVIELALSKGMLNVSYNPEVAKKIADAIPVEGINPEITRLINEIDGYFSVSVNRTADSKSK
jgi:hypothetical protein